MTAEKVKSKLQSLLTASNAKTGKSDTNLTDAVNTLIEGYGQGGGGECSGKHIIEVDTLPEVGEEGAVYGVKGFTDVIIVEQGEAASFADTLGALNGIIATSETFATIEPVEGMICYVTDTPEIYWCMGGAWMPFSDIMGGGECLGDIGGIGEADTTATGYYAVVGIGVLYKYISGQFKELFTKGSLIFKSNGDGTCKVDDIEPNYDIYVDIPSVSPAGDTVTSIGVEAFYDWQGDNRYMFASVTIPNTVTEIGQMAFRYTTTRSVTIPDSVTKIGQWAFADICGLTSITFPDSVTSLGQAVCENCRMLSEVTISKNVTEIQSQSFNGCKSLTNINFSGTMEQWNAITKGSNWKLYVPATKVTCTDGEVTL